MGIPHLVKIGLLGRVGRFDSADSRVYSRDDSVVCRTERGLEIGAVLCPLDSGTDAHAATPSEPVSPGLPDGQIMRQVTPDDQMIISPVSYTHLTLPTTPYV